MENAGIWNFFLLQSLASRARKKMKFFVCLIARFSDHKDGSHHLVLLLIFKILLLHFTSLTVSARCRPTAWKTCCMSEKISKIFLDFVLI